jgi:hypothetical protein
VDAEKSAAAFHTRGALHILEGERCRRRDPWFPVSDPVASDPARRKPVPLSEHEQRLLEQMERALHAEDPKFAEALQGARLRRRLRRRAAVAVLGVLAGAALIAYGVVVKRTPLEGAGAGVVLVCAWLAWANWRRVPAPGQIVPAFRLRPRGPRTRRSGTLMQRMDQRWQHRRERDQF